MITSAQEPTKPTHDVEITGKTEAQKQTRDIRNQQKRVTSENNVSKVEKKAYFVTIYNGITHTQKSEAIYSYVLEQKGRDNCKNRDQTSIYKHQLQKSKGEYWKTYSQSQESSFRKVQLYLSETT